MRKFVSSIGNAAYSTAARSGLAAGTEQPPYPCAMPLPVINDSTDVEAIEKILDATYSAVVDLLGDMRRLNASTHPPKCSTWKVVDYHNQDGDLHLFSRPHVGPYNFSKATLSFINVRPQAVLSCMHAQFFESRQRYSANLAEYSVLHRNPKLPEECIGKENEMLEDFQKSGIRAWHMEYIQYSAPPPVASRDFLFLVEKQYIPEKDAYYIYGCSVDLRSFTKKTKCTRGAALFGWELIPIGGTTLATYVSGMNPNGWAPTFLVGWLQSEVAKELSIARRLLYKDVPLMEATLVQKTVEGVEEKIKTIAEGTMNTKPYAMAIPPSSLIIPPLPPSRGVAPCEGMSTEAMRLYDEAELLY